MLDPAGDPGAVPGQARRAEQLGFDAVAAGEHVFFHGPVSNAFVTLAGAAAVTDRIRLLTALTVLPLYPAALATKMAATLDRLSHGRLNLGIGVGGEHPPEFAACHVPVGRRGDKTDESLNIMLRLLRGEHATADGEFAHLDGMSLEPLPVQRPNPPIWVGGRSPAAARRAGRFGDVWMPYFVTPQRLSTRLSQARDAASRAGRSAESVEGAVFLWGAVARDAARARAQAVQAVSATYNQDFEPLADRYLLTGRPADLVHRLGEYRDAGASSVIFSPACAPEHRTAMIELFAQEVLPATVDSTTTGR